MRQSSGLSFAQSERSCIVAIRFVRWRNPTDGRNKPIGDSARKGAVKKRTQRKGKLMGKTAWTKRNKETGEFMDVKKRKKKFKGVRREK